MLRPKFENLSLEMTRLDRTLCSESPVSEVHGVRLGSRRSVSGGGDGTMFEPLLAH